MGDFFTKLKLVFSDTKLRKRIFFVVFILALFRLMAAIPIPGVDPVSLQGFLDSNQFFGLLNIFSGGGLTNLSIVMLGVAPYITASIIMQLLTMIFPSLKEMYQEEGEAGRKKFAQYSRLLTVPLAVMQGFGLLTLLRSQGVLGDLSFTDNLINVIIVTAGSLLLMWLGELINEFGIGNGVSLLIFAGIVAGFPTIATQIYLSFTPDQIPLYLAVLVMAILIVAGVVIVTEAERPIPITYAKRIRGMKMYGGTSTYLPLRLNQAGVIPIIFALSLLLFPQMIANFLIGVDNTIVQKIVEIIGFILQNSIVYGALYFILVFLFTYFYTAVTFDPDNIASNLQKSGAFIPGVRPGNSTSEYIGKILTRLTGFGALFLGLIAVLPIITQGLTGFATLAIGGTGLLIVIQVVLDLVKQINAQISMREY